LREKTYSPGSYDPAFCSALKEQHTLLGFLSIRFRTDISSVLEEIVIHKKRAKQSSIAGLNVVFIHSEVKELSIFFIEKFHASKLIIHADKTAFRLSESGNRKKNYVSSSPL
jgi:hypothetical protein